MHCTRPRETGTGGCEKALLQNLRDVRRETEENSTGGLLLLRWLRHLSLQRVHTGGKGNKKITITPLTSHPSCHTPHIPPLTSHPSYHTPHIPPLMSHPSYHTPHIPPLMSPLMSHPSQFTVYSYITPQRSTYPHTSHTPPHFTSHSTHTPPCPPPQTLIFSTLVSLNA